MIPGEQFVAIWSGMNRIELSDKADPGWTRGQKYSTIQYMKNLFYAQRLDLSGALGCPCTTLNGWAGTDAIVSMLCKNR